MPWFFHLRYRDLFATSLASLLVPGGGLWFSAPRRKLLAVLVLYVLVSIGLWSQLSRGAFVLLLFLGAMPLLNLAVILTGGAKGHFSLRRAILGAVFAVLHVGALLVMLQGDRILALVAGQRVTILGHELVRVESISMLPTLQPGELMWVATAPKDIERVCVGEVVVFRQYSDSPILLVKRVAAIAGQQARYTEEGLVIESSTERRIAIRATSTPTLALRSSFQVPASSVYVLGDNHRESSDSRVFGAVPLTRVVGKVRYVLAVGSFGARDLGLDDRATAECVSPRMKGEHE